MKFLIIENQSSEQKTFSSIFSRDEHSFVWNQIKSNDIGYIYLSIRLVILMTGNSQFHSYFSEERSLSFFFHGIVIYI
jgi:hypothetical protein